MVAQFVERQRRARHQHNAGAHDLAHPLVGSCDRRGVDNLRMRKQQRLDFLRRDILAAANDDILLAVGDEQIALGIEPADVAGAVPRSEEHTSELQSLMRISYAVFCLKKQTMNRHTSSRFIGAMTNRVRW